MSRRDFLRLIGGASLLACARPARPPSASSASRTSVPARAAIRAVAFDLFTVFDPRSVIPVAEALMPGEGAAFVEAWRTRQFQYSWLRAAGRQYRDFRQITEDAAIYAARLRHRELDASARRQLVEANEQLSLWPDAAATLRAMAARGLRLVTLANFTLAMQRTLLGRVGLLDVFEQLISTDELRAYKPEPRAYQLGCDRLGLPREQIAFCAFGAWDAVGATWFGYPTFWVNRLDVPEEELAAHPCATGSSLVALDEWVQLRSRTEYSRR